ncbi:hypothetical protein [Thalassotalea profundi]|uniref:DUF4304 domain-containing protein n=1 Tax=Thalassotalea profundi TaxID=2036687 RepID=A0ABQ3IY54_9GAMM|nr:hypothetical protein [Thalassotalea profundi]GHE98124.1 hypothetical protein GCM10011501_29560 [Thalassotalea profundi]
MHYIYEIERWAKNNLLVKLQDKKFREIDKMSGSMGAYKTFENNFICISVYCERGIYGIEVGPAKIKQKLWPVSFIKDLIEPASKGRWNLNLEQSIDFIVTHYDWLIDNFSFNNYKKTNELINERCKETF